MTGGMNGMNYTGPKGLKQDNLGFSKYSTIFHLSCLYSPFHFFIPWFFFHRSNGERFAIPCEPKGPWGRVEDQLVGVVGTSGKPATRGNPNDVRLWCDFIWDDVRLCDIVWYCLILRMIERTVSLLLDHWVPPEDCDSSRLLHLFGAPDPGISRCPTQGVSVVGSYEVAIPVRQRSLVFREMDWHQPSSSRRWNVHRY